MKLKALLSITLVTGAMFAAGTPAMAESARLKIDSTLYMNASGHPTQFGTAEAGTIVQILERNGKRNLVLLPDGRKAWIRATHLEYDYLDYGNETSVGLFEAPDDHVDGGVAFNQNISSLTEGGFSSDAGTGGSGNGGAFNQDISIIHGFSN